MKTIDKEYKEKVMSVKRGDVLRCTNYHGEHHYYMLAYHHTGYSNDWCAYGPRMTKKDFYCAVDLRDGDLFSDSQFEESGVADPSILKIVDVLTKWYKTVEHVPYYGTVGQPKEDEAQMSIYRGMVQAHQIGAEITDMLEKYGMDSEEGKMLMSEIKTAFDNYNLTYVSFEQEQGYGNYR